MRGTLARLERMLAGMVEGSVGRWSGGVMQPAELGNRLEEAMEAGVLVGVHALLAPNRFVVTLDPTTYGRFAGALEEIQRDLEQYLAEAAARRQLRNIDPFRVELQSDRSLVPPRFHVDASFQGANAERNRAGRDPGEMPAVAAERTLAIPRTLSPPTRRAALELRGPDGVRRLALEGAECRIGRADDNDVVLPDQLVSRHHAAIRRSGEEFVLVDLGSANGVRLNGQRVDSASLHDRDHILVGTTELRFRLQ